jgi:hypothetical protein
VVVAGGCGVPVAALRDDGVSGTLSVAGPAFGEVTLAPRVCHSGELQSFLGADFVDSDTGLVARLAIEPLSGPGVRVFKAAEPFGAALVMRPSDCEVFRFEHERNGWQLNDVYIVRVWLELECRLASGDRVQGDLRAEACS